MFRASVDLFSFETDGTAIVTDREYYRIDIDAQAPRLEIEGEQLFSHLAANGYAKSEHFEKYRTRMLSKFVLTCGRAERAEASIEYSVGFWNGEYFCDFDGYRLYPDPAYWVYFPPPPSNFLDLFSDDLIYEH